MIHLLWFALAIPIIVHLVFRRKAKPMPFSTLYFLRLVDQRVARRQRLKELLLLLLRLAFLAAIIGAIERPMLRSKSFKGSGIATTAVIVLDNTASMSAVSQGSSTFARAQAATIQVLDGLKSEDTAALIPMDSPDSAPVAPATALADLRTRVAKMECGHGTAELSAPLRRALQSFKQGARAAREIYVITDMQKRCWTPAIANVAREVPADVPVYLVDVGADATRNLAVRDVNSGLKVSVAGVVTGLHCLVENTGPESMTRKVSLFIEGQKVAEQEVTLAPAATRSVVFHHVFERMGDFSGCVELDADDLPADNRRYFTLHVLDKLPVLVVSGDPSVIPYRDGAFYLKLALQANLRAGQSLSPVQATAVTAQAFLAQKLADYSCVILANIPRVDHEWARRLGDYVQSGGGLLIFCGDNVDPAAYNAAIGPSAGGWAALLPANLGAGKTPSASGEAFFRIRNTDASHPIFRDIVEMDVSNVQVKRFFSTEPPAKESGATPLVELADGPLFLLKKAGAGAVILCTSTCTPAWTNLPLKPCFLPILHQMVYYLSRSTGEESSVPAGMTLRLKIAEIPTPTEVKFIAPARGGGGADPEPPAKAVMSALLQGENQAVFAETQQPGIYRAEYAVAGNSRRRLFAVNTAPEESDLQRLPLAEAVTVLKTANLTTVREADQLAAVVRRQREGLPLWDYLLLAALVAAVCESFVGNVFLKH